MSDADAQKKMVEHVLELIDDLAESKAELITTKAQLAAVQAVLQDFIALAMFLVKQSGGSVKIGPEDLEQFSNAGYVLSCHSEDFTSDRKILKLEKAHPVRH